MATDLQVAATDVARAYRFGTIDDQRAAMEELYRVKREHLEAERQEKLDAIEAKR